MTKEEGQEMWDTRSKGKAGVHYENGNKRVEFQCNSCVVTNQGTEIRNFESQGRKTVRRGVTAQSDFSMAKLGVGGRGCPGTQTIDKALDEMGGSIAAFL